MVARLVLTFQCLRTYSGGGALNALAGPDARGFFPLGARGARIVYGRDYAGL